MFQYELRAEQRGITYAYDRLEAWEQNSHFNDIRIKFCTLEPFKKTEVKI